MWAIFDLDGTLADIEERRQHCTLGPGKLNWDEFFNPENIKMDKPNPKVIKMCHTLKRAGYEIAIFSGRSDRTRQATEEWLDLNFIDHDLLVMRPEGDYTPDDQLKLDWLNHHFPDRSVIDWVFDDRNKVVDMWRKEGLTCMQVAPGDF